MRRALYISYDGMTDPLGSSQVIPYLAGLSALGHKIAILSCEKPERFRAGKEKIAGHLRDKGIQWTPLPYHKFPPVLSTVYDAWRLFCAARKLVKEGNFDTVHCRSYIPSLIGLALKRRYGLAFVFDMRGFWADERVDGNLWNLRNPIYWLVYRFFKAKEREFLRLADAVVSLTYAGESEMKTWPVKPRRVDVIPCCADLERFRRDRVDPEAARKAAERLGLGKEDKVLVYLGSIGTWYLLDEMLEFFHALKTSDPAYRFLLVTPDDPEFIRARAREKGIDDLRITAARHDEVPAYLSLARLGVFFIRPVYSKKSSSPTKLGELLAMEIPVVANGGVGDMDHIFQRYRVGHLMNSFSASAYAEAAKAARRVEQLPKKEIRAAAEEYFSLSLGVNRYQAIYARLSGEESP